jgi:hypothetical protein
MNSSFLIKYTLQFLDCNQKELSKKLLVSQSQITKWKSNEHISHEMEDKIKSLSNIGERDMDSLSILGSIDNYDKWMNLIGYLAENANEESESGYTSDNLHEGDREDLLRKTLNALVGIGAEIPSEFPGHLIFDYSDYSEGNEEIREEFFEDKLVSVIYKAYKALTDIDGFKYAYITDILNDAMDNEDQQIGSLEDEFWAIDCEIINLAFIKSISDHSMYPKFNALKYETLKTYTELLNNIKEFAFTNKIPLKAELMDLISLSHDKIGAEAEAKSLGFRDNRIHPDIYMNELLEGSRVMHKVLAAICKKLDIKTEDLKLDEI